MSQYYSGSGSLELSKTISRPDLEQLLKTEWPGCYRLHEQDDTYVVELELDGYFGYLEFEPFLDPLKPHYRSGDLYLVCEDDHCLYDFKPGAYTVEYGSVVFDSEIQSRIEAAVRPWKDAIAAYAAFDLETAETKYVLDRLTDTCGLTPAQIESLGFGFLYDTQEEAT